MPKCLHCPAQVGEFDRFCASCGGATAVRGVEIVNEWIEADELAAAITDTATRFGYKAMESVKVSSKEDGHTKRVVIIYEFIYFLMNIADRIAFRKLGAEARSKLLDRTGDLVMPTMIESMFGHWPQDIKAKMLNESFEKLNDAQIEYATCTKIMDRENPTSPDSAAWMFAGNLAELMGESRKDVAILMTTFTLGIDAMIAAQLSDNIAAGA